MREADFWLHVAVTNTCWLWQSGKQGDGYGTVIVDGQRWLAHRKAWELTRGPIPAGLSVLHHCDVRPCVRPDHLWLGTQADNMRDAATKGRIVSKGNLTVGSQRSRAKLTETIVAEARQLYASGNWPYHILATRYGVSYPTMRWAIRGDTWKHVK